MPGATTDEALRERAKAEALEPPEAWRRLAAECRALPAEDVPIGECAGRVLAETVRSAVTLPRETNSAMDGFGVRAAEGPHDHAAIVGESRAGAPFTGEIPPGAVIRIATGGTLPPSLDAAVKVEDAVVDGERVSLPAVDVGNNIRFAGEDLQAGGEVLPAGTRIAAHHLTALAAIGIATVRCHSRPVVSLVVTGDEVVPPGAPVGPGQVTDVHGVALPALVRAAGGVVGEILHAPDRRTALVDLLNGLSPADVVLVTGGLSVGEHDHTRPALAELGVELIVERLLLRPGQPTAIGARSVDPGDDAAAAAAPAVRQLWFGLPGNPVSAFAVSALFVVPALRVLGGAPDRAFAGRPARLTNAARPDGARWLALRGIRRGDAVEVLQGQGSHMVSALADANALVLLPPGPQTLAAGETVDVLDLDELVSPGALA